MTATDSDPVVLITGATGPLGRAAVAHFGRDGARLGLTGRDPAHLAAVVSEAGLEEDRHLSVVADLVDRGAAQAVADQVAARFGSVDVLLHAVGGWATGSAVVELDPDEVRRMLDLHLWSTLNIVQAVVPGMLARGFGRIVAVSSPVAANPGPKSAAYAIGKSAEELLLRALARETAGTGVTANLLVVRAIAAGDSSPASAVLPEALVDTIAYLVSPGAGSVTGQRITVGG
jgi:NAD(P)-dependent dehydrogenase (short-subunit alcohol dehydrogenase family)